MKNNKNLVLENLDFSKTVLMLLVVLYHSMIFFTGNWFNQEPMYNSKFFELLSQVLNSFHIYAFVLVSGYIYAHLKYEKNKYYDLRLFLKNKFKRLIVPYIFISLFWVIPFHIYFFNTNIKEILIKYFLGISPSQLWFLLMIFNVFIIVYFIGDIIYSSYIKGIFYSIVIYIIGLVAGRIFPNIYQIITASLFFIYFVIGMLIYKSDLYILKKIHSCFYILVFVVLWILKLKISLFISNLYIYKIYNLGLDFLIHIVGAVMAFIVLGRIGYRLKNSKYNYKNFNLYNFLEKYNFTIYLVHQQIIYCVINNLNGKISSFALVNANFFISVFISGIISLILRKINFTKKILNL